MRKLLILTFSLPLIAWAQSSLPPCPETGIKRNCFGSLTYANGNKYVSGFGNDSFHGEGILYRPDGSVQASGRYESGTAVHHYALDSGRFPFIRWGFQLTPEYHKEVYDQLLSERKKRKELEAQLAEAKERERQQAQVPQPQRPQVALRNERRLALVIGTQAIKSVRWITQRMTRMTLPNRLRNLAFKPPLFVMQPLVRCARLRANSPINYRQPMWH